MKALLPKVSIVVSAILMVGAGLALAATPSRPGMFLYPVKQLTRSVTDYFAETIVIGVPALVRGQAEPGPTATATSLPTIAEEATVEAMPAVDAADTVAEMPPQPTATPARGVPDPALLVRPDATVPVVLAADRPSALDTESDAGGTALSQLEPAAFVEQRADERGGGSDEKRKSDGEDRTSSEDRSDDDDKGHEDD
jgi:hypothetical protein